MERIRISPHITIGPQLSLDELEVLSHHGFKTVVNLSRKGELGQIKPDEEEAQVRQHGMDFLHFPVSMNNMGTKHVEDFLSEIGDYETPVYIHCRLGQRSGPFALLLHAARKNLAVETVKKHALQLGLVWHSPFLNHFVEKSLQSIRAVEA